MTQTILNSACYTQRITIEKLALVPGQYSIRIESQYTNSENPDQWRTMYYASCNESGLQGISEEIRTAIETAIHPSSSKVL